MNRVEKSVPQNVSKSKKDYIMYDSNYITSVQGKTTEVVKRSVVSRGSDGGEGRLNSE